METAMTTSQAKIELLRTLESERGRLDPEDVVEAARDPESVLHNDFEWDDTEAARQHRLNQARRVIRSVRLNVTVNRIPLSVPAYVRDLSGDVPGYRNILEVRNNEDAARATVIDAMQRVTNAVKRAKTLAAALGLAEDLNHIDDLATGIIGRVRNLDDQPEGRA